MTALGLGPELHALGVAIGLLDDQDALRTDWFADPLTGLRRILVDPGQRAALLDMIDGLLPEDPDGPDEDGESWHPLLDGEESSAQLFVTLRRSPDGEAEIGMAGRIHGVAGPVTADVTLRAGLVHAGADGLTAVVGTAAAPVRLVLALTFDATDTGFDEISVDARIAPLASPGPTADIRVEVGVVGTDGIVERTALDPHHLGADGLRLVTALLQHRLDVLAADPATPPPLAALARHLLPVAGLGAGLPPLPLDRLGRDADLLRTWVGRLLDAPAAEGRPAIQTWLGHVAGLFAASPPAGSGTEADPWAIQVAALGTGGVELTIATRPAEGTRQLLIGARLNLDVPAVRAQVAATLLAIPSGGTAPAAVLPSASAAVRAPRDPALQLVDGPDMTVGSLQAGVAWDGTTLRPVVELLGVRFAGATYPVVDLSNVDSAQAAVATAARDVIRHALGDDGPGRHLAALAGLLPPATDEGSPLADPAALVSAPTRELGRLHRAVLTDPTRGWQHMLKALGGVLGLTGSAVGTGTLDDPWRLGIAAATPFTVELAAWTEAGVEPVPLRVGLRASADRPPLTATWVAELLAVDLPAGGSATVALMAGQHARLALTGPFTLDPVHGMEIGLQSVDAAVDWRPGSRLAPVVRLHELTAAAGSEAGSLPSLALPATGFDATQPDLGLGVPVADLFAVTRILLARLALSWAGTPGFALAGLLGLHRRLPGLPNDWPLLAPPEGAGLDVLLADPLRVLRAWLQEIATGLSADGTPFALHALAQLREWLQGALPDLALSGAVGGARPATVLADRAGPDLDVGGSGTYADPWRLGLTDVDRTELLVWLEPDGPPPTWAAAIGTAVAAVPDPGVLLTLGARLLAFAPALLGPFSGDVDALASTWALIESELGAGDGVVPLDAQVPDAAGWTAGSVLVDAAHHLLPSHPDAMAQIHAQLDAWQPLAERAALFLGPPFADHTVWAPFLATVGGTDPGAHFDLRSAPDPAAAPLGQVTAQVAHYTADLLDDGGDLAAVTAQIAAVVGRVSALRGGAPVALVAHSTAGLAARAFTAANPTLVRGLITLGTPHGPAPLSALTTPDGGDALRAAHRLLATAGGTGSIVDAIGHLTQVLDGWAPGELGATPVPVAYPMARFTGSSEVDTGGVPALAVAGQLGGGLFPAAANALRSLATGAAGRAAPTHVAFGLRAALSLPAAAVGDIEADAGVRIDAIRVGLSPGAAAPVRPAQRLDIDIRIARPGGWLLSGSAARVRRAELGLTAEATAGGLRTTPRVRLVDAALAAPTQPVVELGDAMAEGLLDAVVGALPAAQGTAGAALVDALDALGLVVRDATGRVGLSADALGALRADAGDFLRGRIQPALERADGLLGITGPPGGPWLLAVPGAPLEIDVAPDPWHVTLRAAPGLDLGAELRLAAELGLTLPGLQPTVAAGLTREDLALEYSSTTGALTFASHVGVDPIAVAPAAADLPTRLARPLLEALAAAVATAGLEHVLGPGWTIGSILTAVRDPSGWLRSPPALGDGTDVVGDRVAALLRALSTAAADTTSTPGLALPGGFRLTAEGTPVALTLMTDPALPIPAPGGQGTLDVALSAIVDQRGHVTPGGGLTVDLPLDTTWGGLALTLDVAGGVVSLAVRPRPSGGGPALVPIVLLPRFGGLGALAVDAAEALLPATLDAIVAQLPAPVPALAGAILDIADALGIHGGAVAPTFAAHGAQLRALAQPGALDALVAPELPGAIVALWTAAGLPGVVSTDGTTGARWAGSVAGAAAGARIGWATGLGVEISVDGLAAGPLRIDHLAAGVAGGTPAVELDIAVDLPPEAAATLGLRLAPQLSIGLTGGLLSAALLPLGAGTAAVLAVELLPRAGLALGAGGPAALIEQWAVPLAANAVVGLLPLDTTHLWTGGPTVGDVLSAAGLTSGSRVPVPLPALSDLLLRGLAALAAAPASLKITDSLEFQLVVDTTRSPARLGFGLHGHVDVAAGPVQASVRLGETAPTWIADPPPALRLLLIESSTFRLRPELRLAPFGLRVTGPGDTPLLSGSRVRLGAVTGYGWADFDLESGVRATRFGAAVDLEDIGLPLSGAAGGDNPVAASLLGSGPTTDGDEQGLAPGLGLVAVKPPDGDFALLRVEDGAPSPFDLHPLWFGIHRSFGPIAVDQIGFAYVAGPPRAVEIVVDGGVSAGGLVIQADELGVTAPLDGLASPGRWSLDLKGLAVAMTAGPVALAGGLVKRPGPPIDYVGLVNVQVAGKGFSAVGAYARPSDAAGGYPSLFVFVALPIVIGGPPYLFITGLGGGAGYNRRLIPPADVTAVAGFPLVTAIDGGLVDDPMQALDQLGTAMPPKRGSLWLAAGVRFTSFALVETTAVAYLALDRGVEVGVLGVSRASIPTPATALAEVELAIKARFSSQEGVLSVQAQLTDHSWLLSRDCQLTGGFAFFVWFQREQFVLTLGGYHPAFARPPEFPTVPRLGFHWAVSDAIAIKGESYFALTSSCVMAGGRLEAGYSNGGIEASFVVYADFLISWDPFHYDISAGVSISAGFHQRICFIACVTIDVRITVGASVHILGPPLHGKARVDLGICSITVAFGPDAQPPPNFLGWDAFAAKYIVAGAADGSVVSAHAGRGLLVAGAGSGHPGSADQPWLFVGDFSVTTETRMPATTYTVNGVAHLPALTEVPATLDIAPCNVAGVSAVHRVTITALAGQEIADDLARLTVVPTVGKVPGALWRLVDHPVADATLQNAVTGVSISGTSLVHPDPQWSGGDPPLILISELIDESDYVPLGLATPAPTLTAATARRPHPLTAGGPALTDAAADLLGAGGAPLRQAAGLPASGASALSLRALRHRRSAPPIIASVDGGMEGASQAPQRARLVRSAAAGPEDVELLPSPAEPVLRVVLRGPVPAGPAPTAAPSTTAPAVAPGVPRTSSLPRPRIPLRRSALPRTSGPRRRQAIRVLLPQRLGSQPGGVEIVAGDLHLWDVPAGPGAFVLSGTAAARAVFLDRAGTPIDDVEGVPGGSWQLRVPQGTARLAVTCLGTVPDGLPTGRGPGAIALACAPRNAAAAVGWQDAGLLAKLAPAALLGRGASVRLGAPLRGGTGRQALIPANVALAEQTASETRLPAAVDVVLVLLDARGPVLPPAGPRIVAAGATLVMPAVVVAGGRRLHLFHQVIDRTEEHLTVAVAGDGWQTAGVVGLRGRAEEWARALAAGTPRGLVPDGPLDATGVVTVRYEADEGDR